MQVKTVIQMSNEEKSFKKNRLNWLITTFKPLNQNKKEGVIFE